MTRPRLPVFQGPLIEQHLCETLCGARVMTSRPNGRRSTGRAAPAATWPEASRCRAPPRARRRRQCPRRGTGSVRIQTRGYATSAKRASGQQNSSKMHQRRNVATRSDTDSPRNWFRGRRQHRRQRTRPVACQIRDGQVQRDHLPQELAPTRQSQRLGKRHRSRSGDRTGL